MQPCRGLGIRAFCSVNFQLDQKQNLKKYEQRTCQNLTRSNSAIFSVSVITSAAHQRNLSEPSTQVSLAPGDTKYTVSHLATEI